MADDDLDEEFDEDAIDEDLDEDVLDEEVLDGDDALGDDALAEDELVEETDEEVVEEASVRAKKRREEDEDDEDELDPDDVEADLDKILKDRIAAVEDEEDEDELEAAPRTTAETADGVIPKRANEFMCPGCFLLVNRGQFGPENDMQCPVGESECPAIETLRASTKPRAKSSRRS